MTSTAEDDFGPLCSLIETQFSVMSSGLQTNTDIAVVVEKLIKVTTRAVLDCAESWNHLDATIRLPDELLAACFAVLPHRDRFSAGQVSHGWRCVVLSFPSIWRHIELVEGVRDSAALLDAALARAGCIPVDLECRFLRNSWFMPADLTTIRRTVDRHGHHVRSISWYSLGDLPDFFSSGVPAPLLQSLDTDTDFILPHDFLGGKPSSLCKLRLRTLFLPPSYSAISTLTQLRCGIPYEPSDGWRHLFELCPRLESLTLVDVPSERPHLLPTGPVPPSLLRLELCSGGGDCNLTALYIAWCTDKLTDVALSVIPPAHRLTTEDPGVVQLCAEAVHLDISMDSGEFASGSLTLRAAAPASTQCVIRMAIGYDWEDQILSFETLIRELSLDNLRSLCIDGVLLAVLLERPPRRLTHLTLRMRRGRRQEPAAPYPWKSFTVTPTPLPELQSLSVEIEPPGTRVADGPELLKVLTALCATFPALTIDARGFPDYLVDEIQIGLRADGLLNRVVFHM